MSLFGKPLVAEPQPGADEDGFGGDAPEPAETPLVVESDPPTCCSGEDDSECCPTVPVVRKYKVSVRDPDCCEAEWVLPEDAVEYGPNLVTTDHPEAVRRLHAEDCSSK